MILCDTGPLVALIDRDDQHHHRCVSTLTNLPPEPLLLTWPCMTEAMYLLERAGGAEAQDELWGFLDDGLVVPHIPEVKEWERVRDLMKKYQDVPMDFADASLVVAAERLGLRRIFTIDSHFHIYRINGKDTFEVAP